MALTKGILHKRFVEILELFIDSCFEADPAEKEELHQEACAEFDDFTVEFNEEDDWKMIVEFTNEFIDEKQKEEDVDITPIKHLIASMLEW